MSTAKHVPPYPASAGLRDAAAGALARARSEMATGSIHLSWQACRDAADIGRELGDAGIVADAATVITGPLIASHHMTAARQALCLEALALLNDVDSSQRRRVEAHLQAISTGWARVTPRSCRPLSASESEEQFVALQAQHATVRRADRVLEQLEIATQVRALGEASGRDDHLAWAALWRIDAFAQLGHRVELNSEFIDLVAAQRRIGSPTWRWRVAAIRACLALLDDHIDDVVPLAAEALTRGHDAGADSAPFLDLVLRSELAVRTGRDLAAIESEVRQTLADLPFFAQSWHARVLVALGRQDEAIEIWRALAGHIDQMPQTATEWLVATTAHADLSVLAEDTVVAARLYEMLLPCRHQHNMTVAMAPYRGPVSLTLGRLADLLGRRTAARSHFSDARVQSEEMHAPWYSLAAREAITAIGGDDPRLTPREAQVAELVTDGLTNREIAGLLFLSERTVENHVSSILHRLDVPNRAAAAALLSPAR